jgi:hypothetical protein
MARQRTKQQASSEKRSKVQKRDKAEKTKESSVKQKLTWKEKIELEGMEDRIMEIEEKKEALEQRFAEPDFYKTPPDETSKMQQELNECGKLLKELYQRWEFLEQYSN